MSRIYTRQGDAGQTGILGKGRVAKDEPRIDAVGSLDEVNCALGVVLADPGVPGELRSTLIRIQNDLFEAGAAMASTDPMASSELLRSETKWLEESIDKIEGELPPLDRFILPGGSTAGAGLHWVRTLCRRAERTVVTACRKEQERLPLLGFVNRLSDAFFVFARRVNQLEKKPETPWESAGKHWKKEEEK